MHHAPSVSYPVGRCRMRVYLGLGLSLINIVVLAWWTAALMGQNTSSGRFIVLGAAWLWALLFALWQAHEARHPTHGLLVWTGRHWGWHAGRPKAAVHQAEDMADRPDQAWPAASEAMTVQVVLDWQSGMLLEVRHVPGLRWLWLDRELAPSRWLDLRRAVWGHCGERPQAV